MVIAYQGGGLLFCILYTYFLLYKIYLIFCLYKTAFITISFTLIGRRFILTHISFISNVLTPNKHFFKFISCECLFLCFSFNCFAHICLLFVLQCKGTAFLVNKLFTIKKQSFVCNVLKNRIDLLKTHHFYIQI